ncbi:MerR family transcriptional regulator [bacterium]|nr:MerR family transcriptional regulator [bacterium]
MIHHQEVEASVECVPAIEETSGEEICGTSASEKASQLELTTAALETEAIEESLPLELAELPEGKKYFRIGEVASLLKVEPYVLRYWESEFKTIKPVKAGSGHRVYSRKDVETLQLIKHLLYNEKFSIKGAKKKLSEKKKEVKAVTQPNTKALKEVAAGLKELVNFLRTNSL